MPPKKEDLVRVWTKTLPSKVGWWAWRFDYQDCIGGFVYADATDMELPPPFWEERWWTDRPIPEPKENERSGERRTGVTRPSRVYDALTDHHTVLSEWHHPGLGRRHADSDRRFEDRGPAAREEGQGND